METNSRIDQFKSDVVDMKLKTGNRNQETLLLALGVALMVVGIVVALLCYSASLNQSDVRNIQSYLILSVAMLALSVLGAALFLRYSIAKFLRLWLLRQLYEGQANVDRMVEALGRRD
jgi:membrane-anchored glycerophosphoryl diester phosphodiesterase (GDPDase)